MFVPLHGTGGGPDLAPVLVGAAVAVAIWRAIRWFSARHHPRREDGW